MLRMMPTPTMLSHDRVDEPNFLEHAQYRSWFRIALQVDELVNDMFQ